jgi:hypothetical protein
MRDDAPEPVNQAAWDHYIAALIAGKPVFEAGGTVEIRSLPPSD